MWFSGLLRIASDEVDAYGESDRRTSELALDRTRSMDDLEAAPIDCMNDCARERADSECDVADVVRERELEREAFESG